MKKYLKIIFAVLMFIIVFKNIFGMNEVYAGAYPNGSNEECGDGGFNEWNKTYYFNSKPYDRKYKIIFCKPINHGREGIAIDIKIPAGQTSVVTFALVGYGCTNGTCYLGLNGTVIAAMALGSYAGNGGCVFQSRYNTAEGWHGWPGEGLGGEYQHPTYWEWLEDHGDYGIRTGGNVLSASGKYRVGNSVPSFTGDRFNVVIVRDEEAPNISMSYNDSNNTITATATDRTTSPLAAAGIGYYDWTNGSANSKVSPTVNSKSFYKQVTSAGTYHFTVKDNYRNQASNSLNFYQIAFNYNYPGCPATTYDYKLQNQAMPISIQNPTRQYYEFLGWNTNPNAGNGLKNGSQITSNGNATYYAIWKKTYTPVAKPTLSVSSRTYNGNWQGAGFNNFNSNIMNITGNSQVNVGTYTATITLKDTNSYRWSDNSTGALRFTWYINPKQINATWENKNSFVYNKAYQAPTVWVNSRCWRRNSKFN